MKAMSVQTENALSFIFICPPLLFSYHSLACPCEVSGGPIHPSHCRRREMHLHLFSTYDVLVTMLKFAHVKSNLYNRSAA